MTRGVDARRQWRVDSLELPAAMRDRSTPTVTVRARARVADPTRTVGLRRSFERAVRERFRRLLKLIERQIVELDGFGLEPAGLNANAEARATPTVAVLQVNRPRFDFPRTDQKVAAFMAWLRGAERAEVLGISEGVPLDRAARSAWTNTYIETAYQKGIAEAGSRLREAGAKVAPEWVSRAFNRPVHADRVGLIYTRTFSELDGITKVMDKQISETLALGLAEGRNPRQIARQIRDRVEKIGITRARVLARTEVIAAHADATLNAYVEAGVAGVELEAEWLTAGDDLVCPLCQALEGRTFTIEEARNMLPRHPNCRCAWRPKVIGGSGVVLNWVPRRSHARAQNAGPLAARPTRARCVGAHSSRALQRPHAHGRAGGARR